MLYYLLYHVLQKYFSPFNVFRYITVRTVYASLTAMFLALVFGPWLIRKLRELQIGQYIREEGPQNHQKKAGTPTMGGVLIVLSTMVPTLLWADLTNGFMLLTLFALLAFAAIGFVDDYAKVSKQRNLGLTSRNKFLLQIFVSSIVGIGLLTLATRSAYSTELMIPFLKRVHPDLVIHSLLHSEHVWPLAFVPFLIFVSVVIAGASNAVNLTDGLDGLAIGCTVIAAGALTILTYVSSNYRWATYLEIQYIPRVGELTVFCGALVGASLGFLWYNAHPAEIFMGDVGSLSLGGTLGVIAVIIKQEILLFFVGGIFVIEALSVILQVGSFKLRGKRIFRMAPIHHHFELLGWSESKVIVRFWIAALVFALFALTTFELRGKRVLVVGLARTGVATALFCAARGANVTATDSRTENEIGEAIAPLRTAGISLELGGHREGLFLEQDLIVPSPGVPADAPLLQAARAKGVTIWSEVELAGRFLEGRLIGITGSNGKTTTTSLIEHILKAAGFFTILAGNIGTPLISRVEQTSDDTITVAELSSFQLELIETFRPNISVFLNLTPDHLDRHHTLEEYGRAKARIFENQTEVDRAVLNADDPETTTLAPTKPHVYWFSRKQRVVQGAFVRENEIVFRHDGEEEAVLSVQEIPLAGAHNVENVLAAVAATRLAGAEPAAIAKGVRSFAGVEHRLEFVAEIGGVRYYNDSKATNVDATLKALDAFPGRILIVLGGKDKGSDYTLLQRPLREKAILALLIGAAAEKIEKQITGSVAIERAGVIERAVEIASHAARRGDVVLLAPACASFDQFQNYEHRGRVFKELVHQLERQAASTTSGRG